MIDGIINVALLLVILVGLVLVHELGHFVMARRAGVRVHEFGVGLPPRAAVLYRGKETIYTLNWLPIGGFVRLEGEEGESVDSRAFVNQGLGTRLRILLAGVAVNFVLAWLIFTLIALLAEPVWQVRINEVTPDSPAARAGLVAGQVVGSQSVPVRDETGAVVRHEEVPLYDDSGDLVVAIDGQLFSVFDDVATEIGGRPAPLQYLVDHAGETVTLTLERADGTRQEVEATLRTAEEISAQQGALGIRFMLEHGEMQHGIVESTVIGLERTVEASTLILRGVAELVGALLQPGSALPVAGPLGITATVGDVRTALPPVFLIWFVGLLSANLAVINALPFPPMDGGRVMMSLIQAVSRNRVSPAAERLVYLTGFVMLMALLVVVTVADIQRLGV